MSDAIGQMSCVRHRERVRFFIIYEDFQDITKGTHADKIAAFLRILEVKTNEIIIANQVLAKEAKDKRVAQPILSRWIEVSYNEFVKWSLGTVGRSSFQIADKEAENLLFVKSRVCKRPSRANDPNSSLVEYKEYLLVIENIQAALDGKELPITGELFERYGSATPVENNTPPVLKTTGGGVENNIPPVLKTTGGGVENNRLESITNKEEEFESKEKENPVEVASPEQTAYASSSPALPADLTLDEISLITKIIQEHRQPTPQESVGDEPLPPTSEEPPTVEETNHEASEQRGLSGKTGKNVYKQKEKRHSEVTAPSATALVILDAWDHINGRSMPRTDDQVEAAEELARIKATVDDPKNVRDRLLAQKDGFWQARGVSLKNVVNNFHLAAQGPLKSRDQAPSSRSPGGSGNGGTTPQRKLLKRAPGAPQDERVAVAQEARSVG